MVFEHDHDDLAGFRFFGGEPFLRYDLIVEAVRHALTHSRHGEKRVGFAVATNGTLLTQEHCRFIAGLGFELGISMDGTPRAHDRNRRFADGKPTSTQVLDAISMALALVPATVVLLTLSRNTAGGQRQCVSCMTMVCGRCPFPG